MKRAAGAEALVRKMTAYLKVHHQAVHHHQAVTQRQVQAEADRVLATVS
jgi:myosin-crossreactive antigen